MSLDAAFHGIFGHDSGSILWWQMGIRGTFIFLYGLLLIRLFGRRAFGKQNPLDIVVAIIIGSNLSRALTANAPFLPTLAATAVIVLLFWIFEHMAARLHLFGWIMKGRPVSLIRDGTLDRRAMRRTAVSVGDIKEAARTSGIPRLEGVAEAIYEPSGKISAMRNSVGSKDQR